ncbi:MAG TPA: UPF0182 family protein [Actinomycetota bacterium]|jgi:hypothetical protein|nr:UPF0182 family protein [Actinomycetota bacterium]
MRAPPTPRRRGPTRPRVLLVIVIVVAFILLTSLRGIARFYTDYLWFKEVDYRAVWRGLLLAKIVPAVVFTVAFFVLLFVNLVIADRLAPQYRPVTSGEDIVERYRQVMGPYLGRVRVGVAALLALIVGTGASAQWREWLLFRNRVNFGTVDPQFHKDIGFYVFTLPFVKFVLDWVFVALILVLIITAVAHYLNGGIRPQGPFQRVTPQVKAHLSLILGALAVLKAIQYYYDRYDLNFSTRGVVEGASYTDVHAQLPALWMLFWISLAAAVLLLVNIRLRGWMLPIIAVGLWVIVSITLGGIYPLIVQRFRVEPNELQRERGFISRNIAATRAAYKISGAKVEPFKYEANLNAGIVQANLDTLENARLWDPGPTRNIYKQIQEIRNFYQFADVDVDRYPLNGRLRQVVLSARELNPPRLPTKTWQNRHLLYTHGYGFAMSPSSEVQNGRPQFIIQDIPAKTNGVDLVQPRIYFGEKFESYALVKTRQREFDYQSQGGGQATTVYNGEAGVPLKGFLRRSAFWLRFGDFNLVTTKQLTSKSRLLFFRNVQERVRQAAPFLRYDHDPYPAIVDGRSVWILDAYTTTDRYPYSQAYHPIASERLDPESGLRTSSFNYVRNSVKVTIDAYDGSMRFWVVDAKDPLVQAYRKAFPALFTDGTRMPPSLRSHLRYPEDIFKVQTDQFGLYHVTDPRVFYGRNDQWTVSPDPGTDVQLSSTAAAATPATATVRPGVGAVTISPQSPRMDPYYLVMRLPGAADPSFLLLQPFVPPATGSSDEELGNLLAFMVAESDPNDYGTLRTFVMPSDQQIPGPVQVHQAINTDTSISPTLTLLNREGSEVIQGSMQLFPVGNSILYIRPYYVQGNTQARIPELRYVAAFYNGSAALGASLQDALAKLFSGLPAPPPTGPSAGGVVPSDLQSLLAQAAQAFADADAALKNGDLAGYQAAVKRARDLIERARAGTGSTSTSGKPSA